MDKAGWLTKLLTPRKPPSLVVFSLMTSPGSIQLESLSLSLSLTVLLQSTESGTLPTDR
jgi:hypothetical protein